MIIFLLHVCFLSVSLFTTSYLHSMEQSVLKQQVLICCSRPDRDSIPSLLERFGQDPSTCRVLECHSSSDEAINHDPFGVWVRRCLGHEVVQEGVIFGQLYEKSESVNAIFRRRFDRHIRLRIEGYSLGLDDDQSGAANNILAIRYKMNVSPRISPCYSDFVYVSVAVALYLQLYVYFFP